MRPSLKTSPAYGLLLVMVLLIACSTYPQTHRLTKQRFQRRPADYPITLTTGTLDIECSEIAIVRTRLYEGWSFEQAAAAELKKLARKLGGDAVIGIKTLPALQETIGYTPTTLTRTGSAMEQKYCYAGTVVRYERGNSGENVETQPDAEAQEEELPQ